MARNSKQSRPKPIVLISIEGFGSAPAADGNIISQAKTPYIDHVSSNYPAGLLSAASASESGYSVIGTGRKQESVFEIINRACTDASFASLDSFKKVSDRIRSLGKIHLIGLLSSSNAEASIEHLHCLLNFFRKEFPGHELLLHVILDGQVSAATAGERLVRELKAFSAEIGNCRIATMIGRFYALDNRNNITRTQKAAQLLLDGIGRSIKDPETALGDSYDNKIFDEEFSAALVDGDETALPGDGDALVFWNHRGQAFAQLVAELVRAKPGLQLIALSDYGIEGMTPLFSAPNIQSSLGSSLARNGMHQLRLADSGSYVGITSWLDAETEVKEGIDRRLVPIAANQPIGEAMIESIKETKKQFIEAVSNAHYDFIAVGFSQLDVLAHRGLESELKSTLEALDDALRLMMEALDRAGGAALITSTHGFVERLIDPSTGNISKHHSSNPVPLYVIGRRFQGYNLGWPEAVGGDLSMLNPIGSLADIAPTILKLAGVALPKEMSGKNIIT